MLRRLRTWLRGLRRRPAPTRLRHRPAVEALEDRSLPSQTGAALAGPATRPDEVIRWNRTLLNAIRVDRTAPPLAARDMAMVQVAVFDAVANVVGDVQPLRVHAPAPEGTSAEAAAAAAAHRVLLGLFPGQKATFDAALQRSLKRVADGPSETFGVLLGRFVARRILALRRNDGASAKVTYTPGSGPGVWVPTPTAFAASLLPQWPQVTPFALRRGNQFRPAGPPALTSAQYTQAFNEVKDFGRRDSTVRTAEQTAIALFWADGAGTATPPGHWNAIAQGVALRRGNSLVENARLFALLDIALCDAGIAAWDAKYAYNFWRPVTAIRAADTDGNPDTTKDAAWAPLIATPPFPTYTSGHSTFSAAAAEVLTRFFGNNVAFKAVSDGLPGVRRGFRSFRQAAAEAGQSRIYGGIHYQFDNQDALKAGRLIGRLVDTRLGQA